MRFPLIAIFSTLLSISSLFLLPSHITAQTATVPSHGIINSPLSSGESADKSGYKGPGVFGDVTLDVRLVLRTPDVTLEDQRQIPFHLTLPPQHQAHKNQTGGPYQKVQQIYSLSPGETLLSYRVQTLSARGLGKTSSRKLISRKNPVAKILISAFLKQTPAQDSFLKGQLTYQYRHIQKGEMLYDQQISLAQQADYILLDSAVPDNAVAYIYDFEDKLLSRGQLGESAFMRHYQRLARLEHYRDPEQTNNKIVTILRVIPWNLPRK